MIDRILKYFGIGRMKKSVAERAPASNPKTSSIIRILKGDYLHQQGMDGLVFFLPEDLSWQGPINTALLARIGDKLDTYILENLDEPKRGHAFALPADMWDGPRLIVAIVPRWDGGLNDEERTFRACFRHILLRAEEEQIGILAIPALGAGRKDFPMQKAARLTLGEIQSHIFRHIRELRIVCKSDDMLNEYRNLMKN